ncbi:unnamed protein product [Mytilus edulis]|uniref:Uncharacterized protein n=1 Tax=Mytilus edulis TaxID=6550 RepID=A0A8S3QMG7_MYTED|nr:unnamed protein product [Mytilus edulis]
MTKWVLEHNADVNIVDDLNNAPLTIALANGHIDIVQLLLDSKANLNLTGHVRSETEIKGQEKKNTDCIDDNVEDSLLTRVIRGHTNTKEVLVKMLLKAGADPNIAVKGDDSPLLHAVRTRNIEIIKILLEAGADVKHVGSNSYTALHVYFQHDGEDISSYTQFLKKDTPIGGPSGPSRILQLLLSAGAPTLSLSDSNELPVRFALTVVRKNRGRRKCRRYSSFVRLLQRYNEIFDKEVVSLLIKNGAEINKINDLGETALIRYIKRGRQHALEKNVLFLIEVGADPSTSVKDCNSAFIEALSLNLLNISICLLKAHSDVNHIGANGTTALQVILRKVKTKEVTSSENKDLTDRESTFPVTTDVEKLNEIRTAEGSDPNRGIEVPLILAAELNRQKAMKMLLDSGATVDKLNQHGETALITSLRGFSKSLNVKNIGTVKILLESGASFYLKDKDGNIPLSLPFMSGKHALDLNPKRDVIIMKMLSTLLEKGACPNTQPDGEDTPLMLAADNCLPECVKLLLEFGAHSYHIGKDGLTALHKCISATGFLPCRTSRYRTTGLHNSRSGYSGGLTIFDILLEHQTPEKDSIDSLFHLLWEYVKGREIFRKPLLEGICVKLLSTDIEITVDLGKPNEDSPLIYFCRLQCLEVVRMLLARKADVNHIGSDGKTVLHTLIDMTGKNASDFQQMVEIIFSAKPNFDIKDEGDKSPIEESAYNYLHQYCHYHSDLTNIGVLVQHLLDVELVYLPVS